MATEVPNRDEGDGPIIENDSLYEFVSRFSVASESVAFKIVSKFVVGSVCDSSGFPEPAPVTLLSLVGKASALGVETVGFISVMLSVEFSPST